MNLNLDGLRTLVASEPERFMNVVEAQVVHDHRAQRAALACKQIDGECEVMLTVATAVAIRKMNRQFLDVRRNDFDPFEAMIERAEHADLIQRANELTPMPTSCVSDLMGCVGPILEDETEWQDLRFPNLSQWTKPSLTYLAIAQKYCRPALSRMPLTAGIYACLQNNEHRCRHRCGRAR
jgi:hypothetical protein